jgi:hypothetical protein
MTEVVQAVRYDPALGLAGLFKPLQARRQRPAHRVTQHFNGFDFEWVAPEAPGVPEQTLLLALMALAGPGMQRLSMQPVSAAGRQLREALAAEGELFHGDAASIHTNLSELAKACGYADCGGTNLEHVRQMLRRLSEVTVWIRTPDYEASSRLLSVVITRTGRTRVALNARLALAAWGEGQYVAISMAERLALRTHTAMALHAYLSAVIRLGRSHSFEWARLERAVWGDNASSSTYRSRKAKLQGALDEIAVQGWTVAVQGRVVGVARQSRDKAPAKRQQRGRGNPMQIKGLSHL